MKRSDRGGELLRRYRKGDSDALRELIELYGASLTLFINRYVNNISIAEELTADTFCEIVLNSGRFRGEASLKTYLFTVAKNKSVDYIRRESKYGYVPIEDVDYELCEARQLEEWVVKDEQQRELMRAVNVLPEGYRSVLHLLYFEELSYEQIGRILKKSAKQVKNLAYRARQALKAELERRGFVYEEL